MVRFRLLKSKWRKKDTAIEHPVDDKTGEKGEYSETLTTKDYAANQGQMMVSEYGLSVEEKREKEKKLTGSYRGELHEKKWEKTAKENLDEIRNLIDGNRLEIKQEITKKKEEPLAEKLKESSPKMLDLAPELIRGDIIDREIVYETSGGYVVKVVYNDNGRIETDYYSVSKIYDVEHALDTIQSYKPIIREKTPEKNKEETKDSFLKKSLGKLRI